MRSKISSAYVLMAGVASSRLGLWMFDLSVIQQMQARKTRHCGAVFKFKEFMTWDFGVARTGWRS